MRDNAQYRILHIYAILDGEIAHMVGLHIRWRYAGILDGEIAHIGGMV